MSFRRWTCTLWDEVPPEFDPTWMQYLLVGKEISPTTGRHHWQTYLETCNRLRRSSVIEKLGQETHPFVASSKGSVDANTIYSSKDAEWVEWGQPFEQGHRSDLDDLGEQIAEGTAVVDILTENPMVFHKYGRTLQALEDARLAKMRRAVAPPVVHWYWGDTGTGKSETAYNESGDDAYRHSFKDHGWWDLYRGERKVVFEDIRGSDLPFNELLRLLDRYPVTVSRRGRAPQPLMATEFWITSSKHPRDVYNVGESSEQLVRRCTDIKHFLKL